MGYSSTYPGRSINLSGVATWAYDTEVVKAAGLYHKWDFEISQSVYPSGMVSFAFDGVTSGVAGNSLRAFYRNGVIQSSGQMTNAYVTYSWSKIFSDLKQGDVFSIYCAESAGGGGTSSMKNRKMYILESLFYIKDSGN